VGQTVNTRLPLPLVKYYPPALTSLCYASVHYTVRTYKEHIKGHKVRVVLHAHRTIILTFTIRFSFSVGTSWTQGSSVSIGTTLRTARPGMDPRQGFFSLRHLVQTGSGTHPTSYPVGTRGSFPAG